MFFGKKFLSMEFHSAKIAGIFTTKNILLQYSVVRTNILFVGRLVNVVIGSFKAHNDESSLEMMISLNCNIGYLWNVF